MRNEAVDRRPAGRKIDRRQIVLTIAAGLLAACAPETTPLPTKAPALTPTSAPAPTEAPKPTAAAATATEQPASTATTPAKPAATIKPIEAPKVFTPVFNRPLTPREVGKNIRLLNMDYYLLRENNKRPRSDIYKQAREMTLDAAARFFRDGKPAAVSTEGDTIIINGIPYDTRSDNRLMYATARIEAVLSGNQVGFDRIAALEGRVTFAEGVDERPYMHPEYFLPLLSAVDALNRKGRTTPKLWEKSVRDFTKPDYDPAKEIGRLHFLYPLAGLAAYFVNTNPELSESQRRVDLEGGLDLVVLNGNNLLMPPALNYFAHYINNGGQLKAFTMEAMRAGEAVRAQYELHKTILGVEFSTNGQPI